MNMNSLVGFLVFLILVGATAMSGGYFRPGDWYESLARPWWRPPNWLFAPAWAVLYVTIIVAGWLVWKEAGLAGAAVPLSIYLVQLLLNAGWSAVFFGLRRPDLAFAELSLLWLSIVATIVSFHTVHPGAAWLLVPYLCWVTFAGVLNFTIWRMNRRPISAGAA